MRIAFECFAIFSALICTLLTLVLTMGLSDEWVDWIARKVINISFLIYGPIQTTLNLYGFHNIRGLAKICTMHGISKHTNFVNIFVLVICSIFSMSITLMMAMEKTMDMATITFSNESSIVFRISQMYFAY